MESNCRCVGKMEDFLQKKRGSGWIKECSHGDRKLKDEGIPVKRNFRRKLGNGNHYRPRGVDEVE